ncbi:MAG: HAMP domain-containing histidine kinase [Planctomycetes bacterium]|nr:HAMP domain-containing histidine kinase [Planctomycetota bacterium]
MTTKGTRTWILYPICAAAVIAVLAWTTHTLLCLERSERTAGLEADRQERIRLALWRMESIIAPRRAEEAARPYFHYAAFYAPQRAYTRMLAPLQPGEVLVPSPLLTLSDPFFKLHFQVDAAGNVTSPQVPSDSLRDLAEEFYTTHEAIAAAAVQLAALRGIVTTQGAGPNVFISVDNELRQLRINRDLQRKVQKYQDENPQQMAQSAQEWDNRASSWQNIQQQIVTRNTSKVRQSKKVKQADEKDDARAGTFAPHWERSNDGEWTLFLLRGAEAGGTRFTQGIWADWPAIRAELLRSVADLLPDAAIKPTDDPTSADPGLLLASVPAVVDPGPLGTASAPLFTPVRGILGLSWIVVLAALVVVGVVLRASVDLSKRRGEFVSAVTHELRTPLTTFRMYCEMLAEGMVKDDAQQEYLTTLQDESDHLSRLVENVLTYARVEQGRQIVVRRDRTTVGELIAQTTSRAAERARRSGVYLIVSVGNGSEDAVASAEVATDPSAVEQILTNLIDNAIKYACDDDPRVGLSVSRADGELRIIVSDNGPGVAARDAESIFEPFLRGSNSHGVKQGVGLGLAISRQLARGLGGDLRLDRASSTGAGFVLTLPIAANT